MIAGKVREIAQLADVPIDFWRDNQNAVWEELRRRVRQFAENHGARVEPSLGENQMIMFTRIEDRGDGELSEVYVPAEQAKYVKARLVMRAVEAQ